MPRKPVPQPSAERRQRGFEAAGGLVKDPIRAAGESRGFALSRMLTHWEDIAGPDLAGHTRPVRMTYGREGLGATLTLLVAPAMAPIVQMQVPRLKDRVNATYGYAAVSRIALTQTAATGFAEGRAVFSAMPATPKPVEAPPEARRAASEATRDIGDAGLRAALETMGKSIFTPPKSHPGKT
jgi:hypothetical protein